MITTDRRTNVENEWEDCSRLEPMSRRHRNEFPVHLHAPRSRARHRYSTAAGRRKSRQFDGTHRRVRSGYQKRIEPQWIG